MTDFGLTQFPELKAGTNIVGLRNDGRQLPEINLIELSPDKTVDDVVKRYTQPSGDPPHITMGMDTAPFTVR